MDQSDEAACKGGGPPTGKFFEETGWAVENRLVAEVMLMLAAVWLMLSTLLYSPQLSAGNIPKPLTEREV